jgi:hypothetical protein
MTMVRSFFAAGICLALAAALSAGEPSAHAGRTSLESLLQSPAELDFGHRQTITVKELLDEIHRKDHISIRFDSPLMEAMSGSAHTEPPAIAMTACGNGIAAAWQQVAPAVASASTACCVPPPPASTPLPPPPVATAISCPTASAACASTDGCECGHCCQTTNAVAGNPTCPAKCANSAHKPTPSGTYPTASYPAATVAYPATPPGVPEPPHAVVQINVTAPQVIPNGGTAEPAPSNVVAAPQDPAADLLKTEINIQTIDMHNVSIATALQIALDALPDGDLGIEASGLPIAVSNAGKLDYVVENDGILITSRLKALTYKETRVYSIKHLKDLKAEQIAAAIKQSVRPWSWRSRIDDLGEQLRSGGPRIPAKAVTALLKSGVQLASAESPLAELTAGAEATATDAPGDKSAAKPNTPSPTTTTGTATASDADSLSAQDAVQLGDALVNGLVTFMQASITTVEIMHYADPPTGTIQTVPGKLIITQSQAAHREIAELLKELAEE